MSMWHRLVESLPDWTNDHDRAVSGQHQRIQDQGDPPGRTLAVVRRLKHNTMHLVISAKMRKQGEDNTIKIHTTAAQSKSWAE